MCCVGWWWGRAARAAQDAKARAASFKREVDYAHRTYVELKGLVAGLFEGIFVQRFRDVTEEVRVEAIAAIGGWIGARPSEYLEDAYLRYLGWALSDQVRALARVLACSVCACRRPRC